METLIEAVRVAIQRGATDEAKHQGALACRTILTALEAKEGEAVTPQTPGPPPTVAPAANTQGPTAGSSAHAIGPQEVAAIVGALRSMPPEQLLDMAIARLRAVLPAGVASPAIAPVRFQIVPIGPLATTVGVKGGGS